MQTSKADVICTDKFMFRSQLLGRYNRLRQGDRESPVSPTAARTAYRHFSGRFFLYYNDHSQGFWAVGETINAGLSLAL